MKNTKTKFISLALCLILVFVFSFQFLNVYAQDGGDGGDSAGADADASAGADASADASAIGDDYSFDPSTEFDSAFTSGFASGGYGDSNADTSSGTTGEESSGFSLGGFDPAAADPAGINDYGVIDFEALDPQVDTSTLTPGPPSDPSALAASFAETARDLNEMTAISAAKGTQIGVDEARGYAAIAQEVATMAQDLDPDSPAAQAAQGYANNAAAAAQTAAVGVAIGEISPPPPGYAEFGLNLGTFFDLVQVGLLGAPFPASTIASALISAARAAGLIDAGFISGPMAGFASSIFGSATAIAGTTNANAQDYAAAIDGLNDYSQDSFIEAVLGGTVNTNFSSLSTQDQAAMKGAIISALRVNFSSVQANVADLKPIIGDAAAQDLIIQADKTFPPAADGRIRILECADGIDNDRDGQIDAADSHCYQF